MPAHPNSELFLLSLPPSPALRRLSVFLHALALIASVYNSLPWFIRGALGLIILCSALLTGRRLGGRASLIRHGAQSGWEIETADGFEQAYILSSSFVSPVLVILRLRRLGRRVTTLLITPGAVGEAAFRQLLGLLKTGRRQVFSGTPGMAKRAGPFRRRP